MKMSPPDMRQNAATSSDGGRDGSTDDGGARYSITYVTARARAKPTKSIPHWKVNSQQEISRCRWEIQRESKSA
jgi:hypothetical protein